MEVVIDYEYLRGAKGEIIIKEISVVAKDVLRFIFGIRTPWILTAEENGLNWDDGIVPYYLLQTALNETVAK